MVARWGGGGRHGRPATATVSSCHVICDVMHVSRIQSAGGVLLQALGLYLVAYVSLIHTLLTLL